MELCENGNLLNFLRKNRQETPEDSSATISSLEPLVRVRIAYDVSKGMHYLEDKKVLDPLPSPHLTRIIFKIFLCIFIVFTVYCMVNSSMDAYGGLEL